VPPHIMVKAHALAQVCIFAFAIGAIYGSTPSTQYLATIHHAPPGYGLGSKRNIDNSKFVGNLIINTTLDDAGELVISLCDITSDLFSGVNGYTVFDIDQSVGVSSIASMDVSASLSVKMNVNGCLSFFFNPCCETIGLRVSLDDPVVLSATASVNAEVEAFSFGSSIGSNNININPLEGINLGGFSADIGKWALPPVLDQVAALAVRKQQYCASLGVPGLSDLSLQFCIVLNNFTANAFGVNVCPRLTIYFGSTKLLDISYSSVVGGTQCLSLGFTPQCSHNGSTVSPDVVQLFKSIDSNSDFKFGTDELAKLKALLGIYSSKSSNSDAFSTMDTNGDGEVDFTEFQKYTTTQSETYASNPTTPSHSKKTFSGGIVALAVIMTIIGTTLIVVASLAIFVHYKGIIKIEWLGKIVPSKL